MFKINISEKSGKTYNLESEAEELIGKELHNTISGKDLNPNLEGYEFEITGTSDKAGFTSNKTVSGTGLKKLLLTYGKSMHKRPKREGKKKRSNEKPKGLRLRKTVRGKVISSEITQINLKITKAGAKPLSEVFPDQNKAPEPKKKEEESSKEKSAEQTETPKEEVKPVEKSIAKMDDKKDVSEDKTIEKTNDKTPSENIKPTETPSESETKPEEKKE